MELSVQTKDLVVPLGVDRAYGLLQKYGFTRIDWNLDSCWSRPSVAKGDLSDGCIFEKSLPEVLDHFSEELAAQKKYGIRPGQAHAPFPAWVPGHPEVFEYSHNVYVRCIEFCQAVGIPFLVIHGISRMLNVDMTQEETDELNWQLYSRLIPALQKTDVTVCLENLFIRSQSGGLHAGTGSDPVATAALIDRLNGAAGKECFGFCLDTGHLNLLRMDFRSFIPALGNRIKCLHVNDNDQGYDDHLAPYAGGVADWEHFYSEMRKIDYRGTFNFETHKQYALKNVRDPDFIEPWLAYLSAVGRLMIRRIES